MSLDIFQAVNYVVMFFDQGHRIIVQKNKPTRVKLLL